jgi:hypothetical protein
LAASLATPSYSNAKAGSILALTNITPRSATIAD